VVGSTAGITTIEFEPGIIKDMSRIWERVAPRGEIYHHHETWGDDNGSSHARASIQGVVARTAFEGIVAFVTAEDVFALSTI